jgi:hypothetical protein
MFLMSYNINKEDFSKMSVTSTMNGESWTSEYKHGLVKDIGRECCIIAVMRKPYHIFK